ncbi:pyridine nucleotide-disulfide oxidoreductase [[Actinomadura] parvosata subsp. kistnae]|uniref:Pyridine nucleotide-disulfide oxidoreductase n=1 Tax=[Actinomadura] parvosata subsp. kistnae TaxID=1909395 RepID=A0A1V0AD07_9ACTN|nr:pyridine nucleotide-disulfide oxidoreductase [Nonomuraea sp. ATCC 55076]
MEAGVADEFDVIVIGAGPAGENVVDRAVRGGLTAAIVEERLAGGECSYWACVPSKALLRPIDLAGEVARVPGLSLGPIDVAKVLARRDEAVSGYDDAGQVRWVEGVPAEFVRGRGRLDGPKRVLVTGENGAERVLTARQAVVLATGSTAAIPPTPGLAEAAPWTSHEVTAATAIPERLVVIGGGVVACEMAQAMHGLGARQTTVLVRGGGLLNRMEPFAGELLAESFAEAGIDVRTHTDVVRVERPEPGGKVTVHLPEGPPLEADELLVATGRHPATRNLGLASVGLPEDRPVEVDDSLRATGVEGGWLYAVGDVNGRVLLTHMGKYQARICGDVIAARARGDELPAMRDLAGGYGAPQVVFTDPQICAVGRTEEAARADGFRVRVVDYDMGAVTGAYLLGDGYRGKARAIVDEDRKVLLGVTFAGPGAAELLHAATIAVTAEVPLDRLWHAVPSFPTVSEIWLRLLETYGL